MTTTTDLRAFGRRELEIAARLLTAYCESTSSHLNDGVQLMMNTHSGYVFLTDEDGHVAMLNGDRLEPFLFCFECGAEGFVDDLPDTPCCQTLAADYRQEQLRFSLTPIKQQVD